MNINGDLFYNPVIENCREVVRGSYSMAKLNEDEQFIGIIYEADGHYSKYYLEIGLESLAEFICSSDKNKLITDIDDYAVFNTIGKYIDLAANNLNLYSFLKMLKKYQVPNKNYKFRYKI